MHMLPLTVKWQEPKYGSGELEILLNMWAGTEYVSGGSSIDGADCLGSVFSIHGLPHDRIPADTSMHDPETARATMKHLIREANLEVVDGGFVLPGDLLVFCTASGGPAHLAIVGTQRNTFWHSTPGAGFSKSGWACPPGQQLLRCFRCKNS